MTTRTFKPFLVIVHGLIGILVIPMIWTPSLAATIDIFSQDSQGNLQIHASQLTMINQSQVQPNPALFTDGQIHVALGAPEISISFDGSSFGPLMASLPRVDSGITISTTSLPSLASRPFSENRAAFVPVEQIPFEPMDIPKSTIGGVGGTTSTFQFPQPITENNALGIIAITIDGNVGSESIPVSQTPLPGAFWLYLSGVTAFGLLHRTFKRRFRIQENSFR